MSDAIHLDTNYLVLFSAGDHEFVSNRVFSWIEDDRPLYASAMAWAEFQCGPLSSQEQETALEMLHDVLPMTIEQANRAAQLFRLTGRRSRSLPDCLIAACAIDQDAWLATENVKDFKPFVEHGLKLV